MGNHMLDRDAYCELDNITIQIKAHACIRQ